MAQPEGFIRSGQENKVCKLVKSIYGFKQARRVWYETISKTLQKKLGFQQLHSDAGVHVLRQWEGDHEIILILYVDNLLIMGNSQLMIYSIKKQLMAAYQMKDLGAATSYLGHQNHQRSKMSIHLDWSRGLHSQRPHTLQPPEPKWHQDTTSWRSSFSRRYRTHATGKVKLISTIDRNSPLRFNWNAPRYSFRSNKITEIQCKPYRWASQICSIHPEVSQGNNHDLHTLWWIFPCRAYRIFQLRLGWEQRRSSLLIWTGIYPC